MNHYLMVAYPGCHNVIPLSVATGKKLPLFLDLTHVNPYSVKSNFRLDNSRCFSEFLESNFLFFTLDFNTGYRPVATLRQMRQLPHLKFPKKICLR